MTIDELETPAVVVDLDVMTANLQRMAGYARRSNLNLRPHTKTHKIPKIAQMQIESGCHGITVAKSGEAEVMATAGLDNILVAYPVFGQAKTTRLAQLALGKRIIVAIDSIVTAQALSAAACNAGSTIDLLVEIDAGMRRCGVASPEEAETLAAAIEKLPGVRFAGITFYPGHIWEPPSEQGPALQQISAKLNAVLDLLSRRGLACEIVSGGSTPSAYNSHLIGGLTEIRPGTYVLNDRNTVGVGACTLDDCALRVLVTVVSNAVHGRAVIDGGSKTFSGDRWHAGDRTGFGYVVEEPDIAFEAMSEEHGHLDVSKSARIPRVGERLSVVPNHVCACINMHDRIWYHRNGVVEGAWQVAARGKVA
jgi:D-serine deaminase-like pyridoxal phosphate-dependent protein